MEAETHKIMIEREVLEGIKGSETEDVREN